MRKRYDACSGEAEIQAGALRRMLRCMQRDYDACSSAIMHAIVLRCTQWHYDACGPGLFGAQAEFDDQAMHSVEMLTDLLVHVLHDTEVPAYDRVQVDGEDLVGLCGGPVPVVLEPASAKRTKVLSVYTAWWKKWRGQRLPEVPSGFRCTRECLKRIA